jgi:hypothetical protein
MWIAEAAALRWVDLYRAACALVVVMSVLRLSTSEGVLLLELPAEKSVAELQLAIASGAFARSSVSRVVAGTCVAFTFDAASMVFSTTAGSVTGAGVVAVADGEDGQPSFLVVSLAPLPEAAGLRVVGRVREGMRVLAKIACMRCDAMGSPLTPVVVKNVTAEPLGAAAVRPTVAEPAKQSKLLSKLFT